MRLKILISTSIALFSLNADASNSKVCVDYASRIPGVTASMCESAQLKPLTVRSVKGRVIWGRDIQPADANLRVLVVGGIHGDEMSSVSLAYQWLALAEKPPADSPLSIHWRFIPALNPDGLFARPSRRTNANGVDLNRNFPTPNWTRDARQYWEVRTKRDPRRWPGNKPLSEPESKYLHDLMESFKPNLIVSIHAPYGVLDFDGPSVPPSKLGRLYLDQVGIFPGSLGNYGGIHKGVPVVTIELPSASSVPQNAEVRQMWMDLLRWTAERLKPA